MPPEGTAAIAQTPADLRAKVKAQTVEGKPAFFKLEAQLPAQGRTDTPVAASDKMWVVLKTYAADGENGLHAPKNPSNGKWYGLSHLCIEGTKKDEEIGRASCRERV